MSLPMWTEILPSRRKAGQKLTFVNEYGTLVLDPSTGRYSFELNSDSDAVRAHEAGRIVRNQV